MHERTAPPRLDAGASPLQRGEPAGNGRRRWLKAAAVSGAAGVMGLGAMGALCSGCAQAGGQPGAPAAARNTEAEARARPAIAWQPAEAIAPGVYVWRGLSGELSPANQGRIANLGFVVGERGVVAVDSGVSHAQGLALLGSMALASRLPVRAVVLTHVRQEFVFGASAFEDAGIPIAMHERAAQLMAARCARCLKTLQDVLGAAEMQGARLIKPKAVFASAEAPPEMLGDVGRRLRVMLPGGVAHTSGPGDVLVWDEPTRTVFAGGLLDAQSIPDIQDADLTGWRKAWNALRELRPERIVPGHGPVAHGQAACEALIASNARYVQALSDLTAKLLRAGTPLSDVADAAQLPEFAAWEQYDTIHRRNASIMYLKHERALLQGS